MAAGRPAPLTEINLRARHAAHHERVDDIWLRFAASLGIGLLIGLERERNPAAKAGVRTFALVALCGSLAAAVGDPARAWTIPVGLALVAAMLIAAHARDGREDDPGTTTVMAAAVCYLLGVLAALGDTVLAGALGIAVAALLYFKPEIEGFSLALKRHEQVSVLQFLVASVIVLPILPDRAFGPYEVLNPRHIWLMVVLVAGIGLASYVALRVAGERHGAMLTGFLGGLISSTATTVLYAKRSRESAEIALLARVVVPLASIVPLARIALLAAVLAPALLPRLLPVLGAALVAGLAAALALLRSVQRRGAAPAPESRNPAELATAIRFGALYGIVLFVSAWLSDLAGARGFYLAALLSGLVDIDPIVLSALNLFGAERMAASAALNAVLIAFVANMAFKLALVAWYNRALAWQVSAAFAAIIAGGGAAWLLLPA